MVGWLGVRSEKSLSTALQYQLAIVSSSELERSLISAQAGFSLVSRLSRLSNLSSVSWNLARNSPSTAPSATRFSRVWASKVQVFMLLFVLPAQIYGWC